MPGVRAKRLCPDAIFLPADFAAYRAHSNRFREVLLAHTPLVEPISLDEAFLDVGGATSLFGPPAAIAAKIRADVEREVGVTCSVGVASTKFVAKLASDGCKPDGLLVVPADGVTAYLEPLPVGRLWGVGGKTGEVLGRLAIRTIGDLGRTPESILARLLGDQSARHLTQLAHGIDDRDVVPYEAPKSVGHEETFERDIDDEETILRELLALSGRVASRLRADGYRALDRHPEGPSVDLHDAHTGSDALGCHRRGRRALPRGRRALPGPSGGAATDPAPRRAGLGPRPGRRGAAGAHPRGALGGRRTRGRRDRGAFRARCGRTGLAPGSRPSPMSRTPGTRAPWVPNERQPFL